MAGVKLQIKTLKDTGGAYSVVDEDKTYNSLNDLVNEMTTTLNRITELRNKRHGNLARLKNLIPFNKDRQKLNRSVLDLEYWIAWYNYAQMVNVNITSFTSEKGLELLQRTFNIYQTQFNNVIQQIFGNSGVRTDQINGQITKSLGEILLNPISLRKTTHQIEGFSNPVFNTDRNDTPPVIPLANLLDDAPIPTPSTATDLIRFSGTLIETDLMSFSDIPIPTPPTRTETIGEDVSPTETSTSSTSRDSIPSSYYNSFRSRTETITSTTETLSENVLPTKDDKTTYQNILKALVTYKNDSSEANLNTLKSSVDPFLNHKNPFLAGIFKIKERIENRLINKLIDGVNLAWFLANNEKAVTEYNNLPNKNNPFGLNRTDNKILRQQKKLFEQPWITTYQQFIKELNKINPEETALAAPFGLDENLADEDQNLDEDENLILIDNLYHCLSSKLSVLELEEEPYISEILDALAGIKDNNFKVEDLKNDQNYKELQLYFTLSQDKIASKCQKHFLTRDQKDNESILKDESTLKELIASESKNYFLPEKQREAIKKLENNSFFITSDKNFLTSAYVKYLQENPFTEDQQIENEILKNLNLLEKFQNDEQFNDIYLLQRTWENLQSLYEKLDENKYQYQINLCKKVIPIIQGKEELQLTWQPDSQLDFPPNFINDLDKNSKKTSRNYSNLLRDVIEIKKIQRIVNSSLSNPKQGVVTGLTEKKLNFITDELNKTNNPYKEFLIQAIKRTTRKLTQIIINIQTLNETIEVIGGLATDPKAVMLRRIVVLMSILKNQAANYNPKDQQKLKEKIQNLLGELSIYLELTKKSELTTEELKLQQSIDNYLSLRDRVKDGTDSAEVLIDIAEDSSTSIDDAEQTLFEQLNEEYRKLETSYFPEYTDNKYLKEVEKSLELENNPLLKDGSEIEESKDGFLTLSTLPKPKQNQSVSSEFYHSVKKTLESEESKKPQTFLQGVKKIFAPSKKLATENTKTSNTLNTELQNIILGRKSKLEEDLNSTLKSNYTNEGKIARLEKELKIIEKLLTENPNYPHLLDYEIVVKSKLMIIKDQVPKPSKTEQEKNDWNYKIICSAKGAVSKRDAARDEVYKGIPDHDDDDVTTPATIRLQHPSDRLQHPSDLVLTYLQDRKKSANPNQDTKILAFQKAVADCLKSKKDKTSLTQIEQDHYDAIHALFIERIDTEINEIYHLLKEVDPNNNNTLSLNQLSKIYCQISQLMDDFNLNHDRYFKDKDDESTKFAIQNLGSMSQNLLNNIDKSQFASLNIPSLSLEAGPYETLGILRLTNQKFQSLLQTNDITKLKTAIQEAEALQNTFDLLSHEVKNDPSCISGSDFLKNLISQANNEIFEQSATSTPTTMIDPKINLQALNSLNNFRHGNSSISQEVSSLTDQELAQPQTTDVERRPLTGNKQQFTKNRFKIPK